MFLKAFKTHLDEKRVVEKSHFPKFIKQPEYVSGEENIFCVPLIRYKEQEITFPKASNININAMPFIIVYNTLGSDLITKQ